MYSSTIKSHRLCQADSVAELARQIESNSESLEHAVKRQGCMCEAGRSWTLAEEATHVNGS